MLKRFFEALVLTPYSSALYPLKSFEIMYIRMRHQRRPPHSMRLRERYHPTVIRVALKAARMQLLQVPNSQLNNLKPTQVQGWPKRWVPGSVNMSSPACCRHENVIFPPHIHGTWDPPFRASLYIPQKL